MDRFLGLGHAGEVGHYLQVGLIFDPVGNLLGKRLGGPARAISDRHEIRLVGLDALDGPQHRRDAIGLPGREEFAGYGSSFLEYVFYLQGVILNNQEGLATRSSTFRILS